MEYNELIQKLPKGELHLHLEGLITEESIIQFVRKYSFSHILDLYIDKCRSRGIKPSKKYIDALKLNEKKLVKEIHKINYSDLNDFLDAHRFFSCFINDIKDFKLILNECILYCKQMNINYAEIIVSMKDYLQAGIPLGDILSLLNEYKFKANIRLGWILDLGWSTEKTHAFTLLEKILSSKDSCFSGITLGGMADISKINDFIQICAISIKRGLGCSIHVGEADDLNTMWKVVNDLHPNRIGHGIKAVYDEKLIHYLKINDIPLEICINSNYATGVVDAKSDHPVIKLLKNDVPLTISSDDPFFFNTNLCKEYSYLLEHGVNIDQIYKLICNSYIYSWLKIEEKELYLKKLRQCLIDLYF